MLPIVPHIEMTLDAAGGRMVRRVAQRLRRTHPALRIDASIADLQPSHLDEGRALLIDDLSGAALANLHPEHVILEQRAALRAGDGDLVVTCTPASSIFEVYCRDHLQLGRVEWLHATSARNPMRAVISAWTDRPVRRRIVRLLRQGKLHYFHPYVADSQAWTLAHLFRSASRRPLKVIGPPPDLCRLVNDKVWFAKLVQELFGRPYLPRTHVAYNLAGLAKIIGHLAELSRAVVVKLPDGSGGAGNVLIPTPELRDRPVGAIRSELRRRLPIGAWAVPRRMLVSCWQSDVLRTPSVQIWIPPVDQGAPVIEGIFEQLIDGPPTKFCGSRALKIPAPVEADVAVHSQTLATVFQHLGYVGRCSFDLILTGRDIDRCRVEFIECNGRWGGTSVPMTLMNRLLGDWQRRPYVSQVYRMPELTRISDADLMAGLEGSLYDPQTDSGRIVIMDLAGVGTTGRLDVITVGDSWRDVRRASRREIPRILTDIVGAAKSERPDGHRYRLVHG